MPSRRTLAHLRSPPPHLHLDWAHPWHICTGTGLVPPTSAPGSGSSPLAAAPELRSLLQRLGRECTRTRARAWPQDAATLLVVHAASAAWLLSSGVLHAHAHVRTRVRTRGLTRDGVAPQQRDHRQGQKACSMQGAPCGHHAQRLKLDSSYDVAARSTQHATADPWRFGAAGQRRRVQRTLAIARSWHPGAWARLRQLPLFVL